MKATSHSYTLAAYLLIPKFLDVSPPIHAALVAHIYHICLSIITQNLKAAEMFGAEMSDPLGRLYICHTPLASWIADLPEQRLLSCILTSQSAFTTATTKEFGDNHDHPCRTLSYILDQIQEVCVHTNPQFIGTFLKACHLLGLNGIHQPFWRDWRNVDPSIFLPLMPFMCGISLSLTMH